jgi:hypothetical protein
MNPSIKNIPENANERNSICVVQPSTIDEKNIYAYTVYSQIPNEATMKIHANSIGIANPRFVKLNKRSKASLTFSANFSWE